MGIFKTIDFAFSGHDMRGSNQDARLSKIAEDIDERVSRHTCSGFTVEASTDARFLVRASNPSYTPSSPSLPPVTPPPGHCSSGHVASHTWKQRLRRNKTSAKLRRSMDGTVVMRCQNF